MCAVEDESPLEGCDWNVNYHAVRSMNLSPATPTPSEYTEKVIRQQRTLVLDTVVNSVGFLCLPHVNLSLCNAV